MIYEKTIKRKLELHIDFKVNNKLDKNYERVDLSFHFHLILFCSTKTYSSNYSECEEVFYEYYTLSMTWPT